MPLFGAHLSIAGGLHKALESAQAYGMETVQLFTFSPQIWPIKQVPVEPAGGRSAKTSKKSTTQWVGKPLADDGVDLFKTKLRETKLKFATAHDSYLINLASPDEALFRKSIEAFID